MYKFEYTLDDTDYLEFSKVHHSTVAKNEKKKSGKLMGFIILLGLIIGFLAGYLAPGESSPTTSMIIVFSCFTLVSLMLVFQNHFQNQINNYFLKINIKNMKKKGRLPYAQNVQIQFDDEYVRELSEIGETIVKYSFLEKVVESGFGIHVYYGAIQAFVIPHRVFEDEAQKAEFLAFISGKVRK